MQGVWLTLMSLSLSPGTGSSSPEQRLREALILGSCGLGEVCPTASVVVLKKVECCLPCETGLVLRGDCL